MLYCSTRLRVILCMTALMFAVVFGASAQPLAPEKEFRQMLAKAKLLFESGQYDASALLTNEVVEQTKLSGHTSIEAQAYDLLADIAFKVGKKNEAKQYDSILLKKATLIKDTALLISTYNRTALYQMQEGATQKAREGFEKVLGLIAVSKLKGKAADVNSNLGSLHLARGENNEAIQWFFKALRLFEQDNNKRGEGQTLSNIASGFYLTGDMKQATAYMKQSIAVRESINDIPGLIIPNINLGHYYLIMDSLPEAYARFTKGIKLADSLNNTALKGAGYSAMGSYYNKQKQYAEALQWMGKAMTIFKEQDNKTLLSRTQIAAGAAAAMSGDTEMAEKYLLEASELARQLGSKENSMNANLQLSNLYDKQGDKAKALNYYRRYILYKDSIAANSALSKVEEIKTRYETEKKDNEIARLHADQRIGVLELEKQKAIIAGNTLEALRKENEIKLLSQEKELQEAAFRKSQEELEIQSLLAKNKEQELQLSQQNLQLTHQQNLLNVEDLKRQKQLRNFISIGAVLLALLVYFLFNRYKLRKKLEQQQQLLQVRNDISRNLHDDIGASLSNISILNELTQRNISNPDIARKHLSVAGEDINRISESLSDIVWNINPQFDSPENLFIRMKRYAADMLDGRDIDAEMLFPENTTNLYMAMGQRRDFYLIFKEAINNTAKYSKATKAQVVVAIANNTIELKVTDNGIGFQQEKESLGNGLQNMKQRAALWNASFHIYSEPGAGTTVLLQMKLVQ